MSWPAVYPPPPSHGRSRSRSPSRGAYGARAPFPDQYYPPPDGYRPNDVDYDRGAWYMYDRERYDAGRRPRSRSPGPDDFSTARKRRRSMSPYDRDRYDPRPRYADDYDTHSRGHGSYSPRHGYPRSYNGRRPPVDPRTLDYPVGLKQYAEWFRYAYPQEAMDEDNADKAAEAEAGDGSRPRNGIKARWEKYKKEFTSNQLQTMFDHHKKSPWFADKYSPDPEMVKMRKRVRKIGWRGRIDSFLADLEAGKFDPQPESSAKEDSAQMNGDVKSEAVKEDETVKVEESKPNVSGDDEMQFNMDADEEPADGDAVKGGVNGQSIADGRRWDNRDEIALPVEGNQVMIRTIPPDIGRRKLENAINSVPSYLYLALGDPLQKRNFYRAGWIRFRDDANMEAVMAELIDRKVEGFKLHVNHNTRPFVNKVKYTPEVASKPDRLTKDLRGARTLASILEAQAAELRKFKVKSAESATSASQGSIDAPQDGPKDPTGPSDRPSTQENVNGVKLETVDKPMTAAEAEALEEDDPEPQESGCAAVERRVDHIMNLLQEQGQVDVRDQRAYDAKRSVVALDLYIAYLRAAFHACYYCCIVSDHQEELQRKCVKHERRPLSKLLLDEIRAAEEAEAEKERQKVKSEEQYQPEADAAEQKETSSSASVKNEDAMDVASDGAAATSGDTKDEDGDKDKDKNKPKKDNRMEGRDWKRNDERWLEWHDAKLALLISRDTVDPRDYGGKNYDEELTKVVEPYMKQEDEGKFRCKTCQKLFKAASFVEKHIANKHPEYIKPLEELPYFNNFALDPHHIQPFTHPPPPVGNLSQVPPPQAYGLQSMPPGYPGMVDYAAAAARGGYYPGPDRAFMPGYLPPPYGYFDPRAYDYPLPPLPPPMGRRDDGGGAGGRRLSERISGYAEPGLPNVAGVGLPPKPAVNPLDAPLQAGNTSNVNGVNRSNRGGRINVAQANGPPPPPPPDAKEDPRAANGRRMSYHDMDSVAEGDVELFY
ncbi:hypothetical protein FISHEDRAFT_67104 [Fistulina hepatica ATCC 64428]|uniref:C2H2-type domain-containing protein n=1 Tax=Fistulina hepatica ATCC 64428 TaxID=1128425 RepID=A0A0D7A269_9AGAR|nr:hypothetical protein FISHEDRAFT_67104 [Fistulina hepatica ATCC 64428]